VLAFREISIDYQEPKLLRILFITKSVGNKDLYETILGPIAVLIDPLR